MKDVFSSFGTGSDWTTVVPAGTTEPSGTRAAECLSDEVRRMRLVNEARVDTFVFDDEFRNYLVLDDSRGTLSSVAQGQLFSGWRPEKLRASRGEGQRVEIRYGLKAVKLFLDRHCLCKLEKAGGSGYLVIVHRSVWSKALDHWILGEILAASTKVRGCRRSIAEVSKEELESAKEESAKEARLRTDEHRCGFLGFGIALSLAGMFPENGDLFPILVGLLDPHGMAENVASLKWSVEQISRDPNEAQRKALQLDTLYRFGEEAWIMSIVSERAGVDESEFRSTFVKGGGKCWGLQARKSGVCLVREEAIMPLYFPLAFWRRGEPEEDSESSSSEQELADRE
ncbi:hypothetical protein CBR_g37057 [Chara braunii]|uniref:Uncharacterized protein n=1 Tax=Chara braunii TaxID=69332 RepID=A0A388LM80_CHABU|nr:hypothetical protein CBR_g37057 [Chara braunii]|eukprot:GBG83343.1 hypothetical protein CBR_g37057 [Chara braunii]